MTPEERARGFFTTCPSPDAKWYVDDVLVPVLAEVIRAGVTEEREACAAAMCPGCRDGLVYDPVRLFGNLHHREPFTGALRQCNALAIRARSAPSTVGRAGSVAAESDPQDASGPA